MVVLMIVSPAQLPHGSKKMTLIIFMSFKILCQWTIWHGKVSISFFKQVTPCKVTVVTELLVVPVVLLVFMTHSLILVHGMAYGELEQVTKPQTVNGKVQMVGLTPTVPGGQMPSMVWTGLKIIQTNGILKNNTIHSITTPLTVCHHPHLVLVAAAVEAALAAVAAPDSALIHQVVQHSVSHLHLVNSLPVLTLLQCKKLIKISLILGMNVYKLFLVSLRVSEINSTKLLLLHWPTMALFCLVMASAQF